MTIKLIYHNSNSIAGGISPFDEAIRNIMRGEEVCLACPYLSVSYLKRLTEICKSWRILTDVEEWLASCSANSRREIQDFIVEHSERVHHYKDLHAKIIVAGENALIGSANFTEKGIIRRIEVSVLLEREEQVEELRQWFDTLWLQTAPVDVAEMRAYVNDLPDIRIERPRASLTSNAPRVNAKMLSSKRQSSFAGNEDGHKRLVERIKLAPSRKWMNDYFELLRELISFTGLSNDDPRLVLSIPQDKVLPVTINRRYVLAAFRHGKPVTGFIFSSRFARVPELINKSIHYWQFSPFGGETEEETPYFIRLEGMPLSIFSNETTDELEEEWREAVLFEVQHGRISPFRKFHESIVYGVAVDLEYREKVLGASLEQPDAS